MRQTRQRRWDTLLRGKCRRSLGRGLRAWVERKEKSQQHFSQSQNKMPVENSLSKSHVLTIITPIQEPIHPFSPAAGSKRQFLTVSIENITHLPHSPSLCIIVGRVPQKAKNETPSKPSQASSSKVHVERGGGNKKEKRQFDQTDRRTSNRSHHIAFDVRQMPNATADRPSRSAYPSNSPNKKALKHTHPRSGKGTVGAEWAGISDVD